MEDKTLTREELYKLVWSVPMRDLAKRYGISDVALAKRCRRMNIPVPGRGYWARKQTGYRTDHPPPLPAWKNPLKPDITFSMKEKTPRPKTAEKDDEEVQRLILFEEDPANKVVVREILHNPHLLVVKTQKAMKEIKPDIRNGLIEARYKEILELRVGPGNISRALKIMDALIKAFEKRGWRISLRKKDRWWTTIVSILEEEVAFVLWESYERYEPVLTEAQKRDKEKYPWRYDTASYRPTGKLSFRIRDDYSVKQSEAWADTHKKKIEERMNTFIMALIRMAFRQKIERIERQKREIERQAEMKLQQEQERKRWEEQLRLEKLDKEVAAWNKAQLIRGYVESVKKAAEEQGGNLSPDSGLSKWIAWAYEIAEQVDPSCRKALEFLRSLEET
ncbi:MAG: hypothetical protein NTX36_12825 [Proteobacteria bacterium]|nr:hypothetical protein [Pseudomonadota bacterium]